MKGFKVFISFIFVFFIKANPAPISIWKGENPITKKNVLVMGDVHTSSYGVDNLQFKSDKEFYAPMLVEFVNSLALSEKQTDFIIECLTKHELDLGMYGTKLGYFHNELSRDSLSTLAALSLKDSKLGNLNFVSGDIASSISCFFVYVLMGFMNKEFRMEIGDEIILNKFTLSELIKILKEKRNHIEKEFSAFKIGKKGKEYLQMVFKNCDDQIKEFEENPLVTFFNKSYRAGKLNTFIKIIELALFPEKRKNLDKENNQFSKKLKEMNISLDDFIAQYELIIKENLNVVIKLLNSFKHAETFYLRDLGFINETLKLLENNKNPIVYCGAAHAQELINFLSYEGYVTKVQLGCLVPKEDEFFPIRTKTSTYSRSHEIIPLIVLNNILYDYLNGIEGSYSSSLPSSLTEKKEDPKVETLPSKDTKSFAKPLSSELESILALKDLLTEVFKIEDVSEMIPDSFNPVLLISNINEYIDGLTLLQCIILAATDTEVQLSLDLTKKLLTLGADPFIKVQDIPATRTKWPHLIGYDCFDLANYALKCFTGEIVAVVIDKGKVTMKKQSPIREFSYPVLDELLKFKKAKEATSSSSVSLTSTVPNLSSTVPAKTEAPKKELTGPTSSSSSSSTTETSSSILSLTSVPSKAPMKTDVSENPRKLKKQKTETESEESKRVLE